MQLDVSNKPMVARALRLATKHHDGIKRKYCGEPYINHPVRVAETLLRYGFLSEEVLSAALLHDCLEDEDVDGHRMGDNMVAGATNQRVLRWVQLLSNTETGNRKERKAKASLRIMGAPVEVQAIKLADIIDNCIGIAKQDPGFAEVYIEEKRNMVGMIRRQDSISDLLDKAKDVLGNEMNTLALMQLEKGRARQAKIAREDAEIQQIIAAEERSVYADAALF